MKKDTEIAAPPYAIRRNFAATGRKALGDIEKVQKVMQHATVEMTELYAGDDKEALQEERKIISLHSEKIGRALKRVATSLTSHGSFEAAEHDD